MTVVLVVVGLEGIKGIALMSMADANVDDGKDGDEEECIK